MKTKTKNMPNLYNNAGSEPDEDVLDDDNAPNFGLRPGDGEKLEEDLEEEADESVFAKDSPFAEASADEDEDIEEDEELAPILAEEIADEEEESEEEEEGAKDLEEENGEDYSDEAEEKAAAEDCVIIPKARIILARQLIKNIRESSSRLSILCNDFLGDGEEERIAIAEISDGLIEAEENGGKIVEGIFNGENMIGPDGKEYGVPANYASKSKLVEGDILKLTITDRGTFIYKQTKPIERRRIIGKLEKDANGNYLVSAEHKKFRVITASITYYKGVPGDKVVILVPVAGDSAWAAVENVIKSK
jgi:hypothetical protein